MAVADVVEAHGLAGPVPRRAEQVEGPLGVARARRRGAAVAPTARPGWCGSRAWLTWSPVVSNSRSASRNSGYGVAEAARPGVAEGEAVQGVRLARRVAGAAGGVQARPAAPAAWSSQDPAPQEERAQRPRQLPGVAARPAAAGEPDGGQQRRRARAVNQAIASSAVAGSLTRDARAAAGPAPAGPGAGPSASPRCGRCAGSGRAPGARPRPGPAGCRGAWACSAA